MGLALTTPLEEWRAEPAKVRKPHEYVRNPPTKLLRCGFEEYGSLTDLVERRSTIRAGCWDHTRIMMWKSKEIFEDAIVQALISPAAEVESTEERFPATRNRVGKRR